MIEAVYAIIYGALLSTRPNTEGICRSTRSFDKVVKSYALGREPARKFRSNEDRRSSCHISAPSKKTGSLLVRQNHAPREYTNSKARIAKSPCSSLHLGPQRQRVPLLNTRIGLSFMSTSASSQSTLPLVEAVEEAWIRFDALWASHKLSSLSLDNLTDFAAFVYQYPVHSLAKTDGQRDLIITRFKELQATLNSMAYPPESAEGLTIDIWVKCINVFITIMSNKEKIDEALVQAVLVPEHDAALVARVICLEQVFRAYCSRLSQEDSLAFLASVWPKLRPHLMSADGKLKEACQRLSHAIVEGWGSEVDARSLIQAENVDRSRIGVDIFLYAYGPIILCPILQDSFRQLMADDPGMPLDAIAYALEVLLERKAYTEAYLVYEDLQERDGADSIAIQQVLSKRDLSTQSLRDLANVSIHERFLSCHSSMSWQEMVFIWQSMEYLGCTIDFDENPGRDATKRFVDLLLQKSYATFDNKELPDFPIIADCLKRLLTAIPAFFHPRHNDISLAELQLQTLKGDWENVIRTLLPCVIDDDNGCFIQGITQVLLASLRMGGLKEAFSNAVQLSKCLVYCVRKAHARQDAAIHRSQGDVHVAELLTSLYNVLRETFSKIKDPTDLISGTPSNQQDNAIGLLLNLYCFLEKDFDRVESLLVALRANEISISYDMTVYALFLLVYHRQLEEAKRISRSLENYFPHIMAQPSQRSTLELITSLKLASFQGDTRKAEEIRDILVARSPSLTSLARQYFLHAHAITQSEDAFLKVWDQTFEDGQSPTDRDLQQLLLVHSRAGNVSASTDVIEQTKALGFEVTISMYNNLLHAFARQRDLKSAAELLDTLLDSDTRPDIRSFTTVMSIMADMHDVVGAERLYNLAINRGIVPDGIMVLTLMDAHIQATSWRGAIRVFDYADKLVKRDRTVTLYLYTNVIKAYVYIGSPFAFVLKLFRQMKAQGFQPSLETYSIVIKAAFQAKQVRRAGDLFRELEESISTGKGSSPVDSHLMTIMIHGYMKNGNVAKAWEMYDNMLERNLDPEPVALAAMVRTYAEDQTGEGLLPEEDFVLKALDHYDGKKRVEALDTLYAPLIAVFSKQPDVESTEKYFNAIIDQGGTPSLCSLCILMDLYRRVGRIDEVEEIWDIIFERATQHFSHALEERLKSFEKTPDEWQVSSRGSFIAFSLSICINALSAAGRHLKIAQIWQQVREAGFSYDGHNWNHLAVALVYAGEVERAFEIVERVLLPWEVRTQMITRQRFKQPKWPLSYVRASDNVLREGKAKEQAAEETTEEAIDSLYPGATWVQKWRDESRLFFSNPNVVGMRLSPWNQADPVQALYEMQQLAPILQGWRSQGRVLDLLQSALELLSSGKLIRATKPEGSDSVDGFGEVERSKEAAAARAVMVRIQNNFPLAMRMVELHARKRQEQKGAASFYYQKATRQKLLQQQDTLAAGKRLVTRQAQSASRRQLLLQGMQDEWVGPIDPNSY